MRIEETEFRKKPILVIKDDNGKRILFSAGLNKVKLIVANLITLQSFINKHDNKKIAIS